jgi:hypothetical protein
MLSDRSMPIVCRAFNRSCITRELAGAAPQIDDAYVRRRPNQVQQVVERLLALSLELVVLPRIPGVDGHAATVVYAETAVMDASRRS